MIYISCIASQDCFLVSQDCFKLWSNWKIFNKKCIKMPCPHRFCYFPAAGDLPLLGPGDNGEVTQQSSAKSPGRWSHRLPGIPWRFVQPGLPKLRHKELPKDSLRRWDVAIPGLPRSSGSSRICRRLRHPEAVQSFFQVVSALGLELWGSVGCCDNAARCGRQQNACCSDVDHPASWAQFFQAQSPTRRLASKLVWKFWLVNKTSSDWQIKHHWVIDMFLTSGLFHLVFPFTKMK